MPIVGDMKRSIPDLSSLAVFCDALEQRRCQIVAGWGDTPGADCLAGKDWRAMARALVDLLEVDEYVFQQRHGGGVRQCARLPDLLPSLIGDSLCSEDLPRYAVAVRAGLMLMHGGMSVRPTKEQLINAVNDALFGSAAVLKTTVFLPPMSEELVPSVEALRGERAATREAADVVVCDTGLALGKAAAEEAFRNHRYRVVGWIDTRQEFAASAAMSLLFGEAQHDAKVRLWQQLEAALILVLRLHMRGLPSSHDRWYLVRSEVERGALSGMPAAVFTDTLREAVQHNNGVVQRIMGRDSLEVDAAYVYASLRHGEWVNLTDFALLPPDDSDTVLRWYAPADILPRVVPPDSLATSAAVRHPRLLGLQRTLKRKRSERSHRDSVVVVPLYATWYIPGEIHELEVTDPAYSSFDIVSQSEWFIETRDWIVNLHRQRPHCYMTFLFVKRVVTGPDSLILQIWQFLDKWGLINYRLQPQGRLEEVQPEAVPEPRAPRRNEWSTHEDLTLSHAAQSTTSTEGLGTKVKTLIAEHAVRSTAQECFERYASLSLSLHPQEAPAPDVQDQQQHFQEKIVGFLAECVPEGVAEAALAAAGGASVGSMAAAALGAFQAKSALMAEQETAHLRLTLQRLIHLQLAKLRLLLPALEEAVVCGEEFVNSVPEQMASLDRGHQTRCHRIQLFLAGSEAA